MGKGGGGPSDSVYKEQSAIQKDALAFGKQLATQGMTAWQPAKDYWTALLQGGDAATQAVGPYAAQLRLQGSGARRALQTLPNGGEKNLALASNTNNTYSQIQRLTEGVQPMAASSLGQLSGIPLGVGSSFNSSGTALASPLLSFQASTNALNAQGAQGLGTLLYNAGRKGNSGGGGYGGTPPFFPSSSGGKKG